MVTTNQQTVDGQQNKSKSLTDARAKKLLLVAKAIAELSKDKSTKVGTLIIGENGEGGPWGYNGAPRGCKADEDGRMDARPEKYMWAEHSERNALYAAARTGFSTKGCVMVVTHFPCMDCARAIVQAGIVEVYTYAPDLGFMERWKGNIDRAIALFEECGVSVHILSNGV